MGYNRDTIITVLHDISKDTQFSNIQIGLFGSYARDEQTEHQDIDMLVYDGIEDKIQTYMKESLGIDCDVVDYSDLEADCEEAKELGIEEYTLKPTIDREAIWIGRENIKN